MKHHPFPVGLAAAYRSRTLRGRVGAAAPHGTVTTARRIRELHEPVPPSYEPESTERRAIGTVAVANGAWWSAVMSTAELDRGTVLLQLERHGPAPDRYRAVDDRVVMSVPATEVNALLTLLDGVVAHARRDGVLTGEGDPSPSSEFL